MRKDLGDFQTPPALAEQIVQHLIVSGRRWERVLEPTCGEGNFLRAFARHAASCCHLQGVETQSHYVCAARCIAEETAATVDVHHANLFDLRLDKDLRWRSPGRLLVVGNPPWVTNATLGSLKSNNLPVKENFKHFGGIEALTGASNFDIAEYIWIKILRELRNAQPTIALLCKTSVARNVLAYAYSEKLPIASASLRRINAQHWFGAAVDAALFTVEIADAPGEYQCPVYADLCSDTPQAVIGFASGRMVADVSSYCRASLVDGDCPLTWRQGVKHDAAPVMELNDGIPLTNKFGSLVEVEAEWVYPLLKSSDLCQGTPPVPRRRVIVPQARVGQDTTRLAHDAPQLWQYLTKHQEHFDKRKSSIYVNQPPFSLFGIGDYSFAPFKVAVAGLTKKPRFWTVEPIEGRPVMLDDTCYFLPCQTREQARILSALLNHSLTSDLLRALLFTDAKRPITKKLLQRIDLMRLVDLTLAEPERSAAKQTLAMLSPHAPLRSQIATDL